MTLRETGRFISRFLHGVDQLPDIDRPRIKQHRGLPAGKIHFHLMHTRQALEVFLDRLLALVAVHALDPDQHESIRGDVTVMLARVGHSFQLPAGPSAIHSLPYPQIRYAGRAEKIVASFILPLFYLKPKPVL